MAVAFFFFFSAALVSMCFVKTNELSGYRGHFFQLLMKGPATEVKDNLRGRFSPSATWLLGTELRSSGLGVSSFTPRVTSQV